ncbi:magnesium transporter NIPA-domain-containing protein [Crepidotus variabilis]|uniref:Magnesium transporter NIPA-domain-containing protein n=1 Tax=Crepidotus variabilis TaxID=179855 RepID=A0A9P6EJ26_9AGAR|nr:magnesium transporter NIPA-domain-containing protein [Crepidotus variabilis]
MDDKYVGLLLSVSGSVLIGSSFIITKMGLTNAASSSQYGTQVSDNYSYLRNPMWWGGMSTIANFAAYTFAPPILITPLGALSVIIGAILASFLLKEELGHLGRLGCTLCLLGSLIIVLHAPEDKPVNTVDEILHYAIQPGFLLYCLTVLVFCLVMIYGVAPKHGRSNPMVYVSICSLAGSVSIMAVKGFGVALKLTFEGNNQLTHPSTYVFGIVVALCIVVQMNYFNKALDTFSTNVVNPMYYVGFSTATIVASLILFQGFNTTDAANTFSLLCGFIVTFLGVHLLNLSRAPEPPLDHHSSLEGGLMNPRLSLQGRMSLDGWTGGDRGIDAHMGGGGGGRHGRQSSLYRSQSNTLFNTFEGPDGDVSLGPVSPITRTNQHPHRRTISGDLQNLPEEQEDWEEEFGADERTALKKGTNSRTNGNGNSRQIHSNGSRSPMSSGSRSHSHSPAPNSSLTDVRITPR